MLQQQQMHRQSVKQQPKHWRHSKHQQEQKKREQDSRSACADSKHRGDLKTHTHVVFFSQPAASLAPYLAEIAFLIAASDEPPRCAVCWGGSEGGGLSNETERMGTRPLSS